MNRTLRLLTAVAIAALMMICASPLISGDSSAESISSGTGENEGTLVISIDHPLFFNDTDGQKSVDYINGQALEEVCRYSDGTLTFTRSVSISYKGWFEDVNIFTFDSSGDQGICTDNCKVKIICNGDHINQKTISGAVISSKSSGLFNFSGNGALEIAVEKNTSITNSFHCIATNGGIRFNGNSLNCLNDYGNGIECSGSSIVMKNSTVNITAEKYAIHYSGTAANSIEFDQCNLTAIGRTSAFYWESSLSLTVYFCDLYGTYGTNPEDLRTIDHLDCGLRCVQISSNAFINLDSDMLTIIIVVAVIAAAIIILLLTVIIRKNRGFGNSPPAQYEPRIPPTDGRRVRNEQAPAAEESPKTNDDRGSVRTYSFKDTVEVVLSSEAGMSSFTFIVDGNVIGYIGPNRSVIDVPRGMHEVRIVVNDTGRKEIYKENVLFTVPTGFRIVKKFKGFSVIRE